MYKVTKLTLHTTNLILTLVISHCITGTPKQQQTALIAAAVSILIIVMAVVGKCYRGYIISPA